MHCRERRRFWSDQGLSGQVVSDTDVVRLTPTMNSLVSDKVKGFLNKLFAAKKTLEPSVMLLASQKETPVRSHQPALAPRWHSQRGCGQAGQT